MSDPQNKAEDELAGTEQPFVAHLVELRDRLIRMLLAIAVAAIALGLYPGPGRLYDLLAAPLIATLPTGATLIATSVISPFMVPLKILLMAAFLIALPVVLYQLWAFVAPGLYTHEKKLVLPLVVSSTVLFFIGVAFCYFFVFGQVFKFIQGFAPKSITAAPDIEAYLTFVLTMFFAFGLAFEVPIAVVVLARLGVVSIQKLKDFRGYFVVLAFIIAAIVTPPDVVSQLALAIPMCLLYELGIWAARITSPGRMPACAAGPFCSTPVMMTPGGLDAEGFGQLGRQVVGLDADPAAGDLAVATMLSITSSRWTPEWQNRCPCCRPSANRWRC
jgi:sec-independent protein translocase protein TatC